jgi:16S rRNA (cytidine1402-2'-O)-methyltransferase
MHSPLQAIEVRELNRHTPPEALAEFLAPVVAGRDAAVVSEAGCPAVADPGAALVALAHARGLRVVPLIGPSSLILALMASGMNGQRFAFAGYVPVAQAERAACLRELERRSAREGETQILIETPYRNQALFDAMLATLAPGTLLSVASELTLPAEAIGTRSVADWRRRPTEMPRAPTVFSLLAVREAQAGKPRADEADRAARGRGAPRGTRSGRARSPGRR